LIEGEKADRRKDALERPAKKSTMPPAAA
jgi:hypothetical protein